MQWIYWRWTEIYKALMKFGWIRLKSIGQLLVTIRIVSVPPCPEFEIRCVEDLWMKCALSGRYYAFDGVIVAISIPSKYTLGASYLCMRAACPGSVGNKFTRFYVPGMHEKQVVSDNFLCTFCGGKLHENVKARMLDDKVTAEMVPAKAFTRTSRSLNSEQAVTVHFRRSLTRNLTIGHTYSLIVMPVAKPIAGPPYGRSRYALEANECQEMAHALVHDDDTSSLLPEIKELLVKFHVQDLADVQHVCPLLLAFTFGEHIAPKGLFLKLKLGILLRLVNCGQVAGKGMRASLLAVGHDTSIVDRLLRHGANFAPRVLLLTVASQLRVTCSQRKTSGSYFVDGSPVLLASTGVCYLGDMGKFSSAAKRTVANILDTGNVPVDVPDSSLRNNVAMEATSYPLECQLWAYIDPPHTDAENLLNSKPTTNKAGIPKYLLDAFGLVYYVDAASLKENQQIGDLCLDLVSAYPKDTHCSMSNNNFAKILKLCQERKARFDSKAEVLIQDYFVASRKIRGFEEESTPLPMSAILALTCTAESIAKLNFRDVVTEEDSVMAIYLYEECLTTRCGASFLHVRPRPHSFGCDTRTQLIEILTELDRFGVLLRHHIASIGMEKNLNKFEE